MQKHLGKFVYEQALKKNLYEFNYLISCLLVYVTLKRHIFFFYEKHFDVWR